MLSAVQSNDTGGEQALACGVRWDHFAEQVMAIYQSIEGDTGRSIQQELRQIVHTMYNQLIEDEAFREQFRTCPDPDNYRALSWSSTVFSDQSIHAGLLSVFRDRPIPLHDHPGALGITLVMSGIARVRYADIRHRDEHSNLYTLKFSRSRERMPGQVCWFFENERNLHSIEAVTPTTQLLVMHLPPADRDRQAFYFPIIGDHPCNDGDNVIARRVKIRRS